MTAQISAIMLAGTILPTPFQEALGMPVLCLPLGGSGTILDAWRRLYGSIEELETVQLVVRSKQEHTSAVAVARAAQRRQRQGPWISVSQDPGAWRGVAGLLHDLTRPLANDEIVLVSEAHCQPPASLQPLLDALDSLAIGVVGTTRHDEPAGIYAFRRTAFDSVPQIGYCDLKEQLLPQLHSAGLNVVAAPVAERSRRVRDLESYLNAVRASGRSAGGAPSMRVSSQASVSGSAILDGFGVIEPGAVVEDGAVVHDSVVLGGATVGGGAVVSRSVIGPKATVAPRQRVLGDVIPAAERRVEHVAALAEAADQSAGPAAGERDEARREAAASRRD